MKPKDVLLTGPLMPVIVEGLAHAHTVHKLHEAADREGFLARISPKIGALVSSYGGLHIDSAFMARFPNLRVVSNFGVGYDGVDAHWAGQHGITVTNTPDVLNDEVADTAIGLLIATVRRLPQADQFVRQGRWLKGGFPLTDSLRGKTMGIFGLGRIGRAIASLAEAFGLKIAYHSRNMVEGS